MNYIVNEQNFKRPFTHSNTHTILFPTRCRHPNQPRAHLKYLLCFYLIAKQLQRSLPKAASKQKKDVLTWKGFCKSFDGKFQLSFFKCRTTELRCCQPLNKVLSFHISHVPLFFCAVCTQFDFVSLARVSSNNIHTKNWVFWIKTNMKSKWHEWFNIYSKRDTNAVHVPAIKCKNKQI